MFENRTAFITGAASGIGRALAVALSKRGTHLALTDIDAEGLAETAKLVEGPGVKVKTYEGDVAELGTVTKIAQHAIADMGNIHFAFNNAGVALGMPGGKTMMADWKWVNDINVLAVAEGVEAFLPHMKAHGEGGHICNTASMAGHGAAPGMGPYNATKFAVVGYTEALRQELDKTTVRASVLCPAWVKTKIYSTILNRPSAADLEDKIPHKESYEFYKNIVESGLLVDPVAEWTLDSIEAGRFYIFTHPEMRELLEKRRELIDRDYDAAEQWRAKMGF